MRGLRAIIVAADRPPSSLAALLTDLRVGHDAILDVCGAAEIGAALADEREARWLAACRLHRPDGAPCERLLHELRLHEPG